MISSPLPLYLSLFSFRANMENCPRVMPTSDSCGFVPFILQYLKLSGNSRNKREVNKRLKNQLVNIYIILHSKIH